MAHSIRDVGRHRFGLTEHRHEFGGGFIEAVRPHPGVGLKELLESPRLRVVEPEEGTIRKQVEEFLGRKLDVVPGVALRMIVVEVVHDAPPSVPVAPSP
jgi:hypothetical protein